MLRGFLLAVAMAGTLAAQAPPRFNSPTSFPWWNNPVANGLNNLSDAQAKQISATVAEYRDRLRDLYAQVNMAESGLEEIFNQETIDQRKADQAVDQLANARGDLTRTLSQMSLKLRTVLTAEQWQDLQNRQRARNAAGRGPGSRRRGQGSVTKGAPPPVPPPSIPPAKAAPTLSEAQK
jgi:Spy/CpxP family protein refolding chaperone